MQGAVSAVSYQHSALSIQHSAFSPLVLFLREDDLSNQSGSWVIQQEVD